VEEFSERALRDGRSRICESAVISNTIGDQGHERYAGFVGLDVHKETIAVAIAKPDRSTPKYRGEIKNRPKAVAKLLEGLRRDGEIYLLCYEAGPCGYGLYRQILASGHDCEVVAAPESARLKTDRRDALKLARLLRSGDLRRVWVPDRDQEAMRDLSRCRGDFKIQEKKAKQQLNAFVLRHGHHWPAGKKRWSAAHFNWLEDLKFSHRAQQIVLQDYIESVRAATARVTEITETLMRMIPQWSLAPVVESLVALRGIDRLTAVILLAELGDVSRFRSPKQLMAFLGLVPNLHNSGSTRRFGALTLAGNGHARRVLIESAWSYRHPARKTKHLKRKEANASAQARTIAWQAQKRLCGRYRALINAGKNSKLVCAAIARELVGFVWAIVCLEMPRLTAAETR
jgi:transposase